MALVIGVVSVLAMSANLTPANALDLGSLSMSVTSIGRAPSAAMTYDFSVAAAGQLAVGGVCDSHVYPICVLTIQAEYADGSVHNMLGIGGISGDPYGQQFTGSIMLPRILAVRAELYGHADADGAPLYSDWALVTDPYPAQQSVSVGVAAIGRTATGTMTYDLTATGAGYLLPGRVCDNSKYSSCQLVIQAQYADGSAHDMLWIGGTSGDPYSQQFTGSVVVSRILAVRAELYGQSYSGAGDPLYGDWAPVTDPYPAQQSLSVSVTSIGRNSSGALTYDFTASAAGQLIPGRVCDSSVYPQCVVNLQAQYADGSIHQIVGGGDFSREPSSQQFTGSIMLPRIFAVRAELYGHSYYSNGASFYSDWVSVADPYPAQQSVSLSVASIGRAASGALTYDFTATAAGHLIPGRVCDSSVYPQCVVNIEAKYADGSIHQIVGGGVITGDPYSHEFTGSIMVPPILAVRSLIFGSSYYSNGAPFYSDWVSVSDPYPAQQSVSMSVNSIGRTAWGYLVFDVSATASGYLLPGRVCDNSVYSNCDLGIQAKYADGSTGDVTSAPNINFTGDPYSFRFTGSLPMAQVVALRPYVVGRTYNSTGTRFNGAWRSVSDMSPSESIGGANAAEKACQCSHADPVNSATGEFFLSSTDVGIVGAGPGLSVARTYSSTNAAKDGPFGFGWSANFSSRLILAPPASGGSLPQQVTAVQENGATVQFGLNTDQTYSAPARVLATLSYDTGSQQWTFIRQTRQTMVFDSAGLLTATRDLHGNVVTVGHDSSGNVTSLAASGGRSISLTWTS
ncbi:MAG: Rhs family protein, partial [Microbacteriaceae bacterium]|nr:Rhs family protein [Microbacteriaceae bacterium]